MKNSDSSYTARALEATSKLSAILCIPGKGIKPCIGSMCSTIHFKGDFPDRNTIAFVLACELRRIGKDYDYTLEILNNWNLKNEPPLRYPDIVRLTGSAFLKEYKYSCNHPTLQAFCVLPDPCTWQINSKSCMKRISEDNFIKFHWPQFLSNRQVLIYSVALRYLEKRNKVKPGNIIYANHKQIADACGISRPAVGKDLLALAKVGLIEYEAGSRRKWEGIASEVNRIVPIPRLTQERINIIKGVKI